MSTRIIVFNRIIFYATINLARKTVFEKYIPMYILYKSFFTSMILAQMCPVAYVRCCRLNYVHVCKKTHFFPCYQIYKSGYIYIHFFMLSLIRTNYRRYQICFIFWWSFNVFGPNSHGNRLYCNVAKVIMCKF